MTAPPLLRLRQRSIRTLIRTTLCSNKVLAGYLLGGISVHMFHVVRHHWRQTVENPTQSNVIMGRSESSNNDRCASTQDFFDAMDPMGTDKTFRHGYHWFYGPALEQYKSKRGLNMLEIGAKNGASTAGWTKYFDDAKVDMMTYGGEGDSLNFERKECELGDCSKVTRFEGDQSDTDFLDSVVSQRKNGWDIIIDDASHVPAHNIITFEHLWKHVKPGGIYVVEDVETSYYPKSYIYGYHFEAGISAPSGQNSIKRFREYADVINRGYFPKQVKDYSLFEGDDTIEEIGFSRNIIYVRKANNDCEVAGKTTLAYPDKPIDLSQKSFMTESLKEAKRMFVVNSKHLDQWRTAPSYKRAPNQ